MGIEVLIAIIGLGSVILGKTLEVVLSKWFSRAKDKADANMDIRDELRTEIARKNEELVELRAELRITEERLDALTTKYYEVLESYYRRVPPHIIDDGGTREIEQ